MEPLKPSKFLFNKTCLTTLMGDVLFRWTFLGVELKLSPPPPPPPPATLQCMLCSLLSSLTTCILTLQVWIKDLVFLPFVAILLLLYTFFYFKLPETKGKSFREISALVGMADSPGSESEAKPQVKDQKPELHQWSGTNAPSDSVKDHKPTHDVQSSDTVKNGGGDGHHKYGSTDHVTLFERVS